MAGCRGRAIVTDAWFDSELTLRCRLLKHVANVVAGCQSRFLNWLLTAA
jgi:hypothetical protein